MPVLCCRCQCQCPHHQITTRFIVSHSDTTLMTVIPSRNKRSARRCSCWHSIHHQHQISAYAPCWTLSSLTRPWHRQTRNIPPWIIDSRSRLIRMSIKKRQSLVLGYIIVWSGKGGYDITRLHFITVHSAQNLSEELHPSSGSQDSSCWKSRQTLHFKPSISAR